MVSVPSVRNVLARPMCKQDGSADIMMCPQNSEAGRTSHSSSRQTDQSQAPINIDFRHAV